MTDVHDVSAQEGIMSTARAKALPTDFWTFWTGQTISNLGSSFTQFALPLLIFKLTSSAINLGLATAATFLPYLLFDAFSFLVSALSLGLVARRFNTETDKERTAGNIRQDVVEGLRYVLSHPVLRNISAMMALVNFVGSTTGAQLVFFAKHRIAASDSQVALLYSAGSVGVVVLSLAAGPLRRRWPFSKVALSALMLDGLLTVVLALTHWYWAALLLWALVSGLGILFNINTGSLRQAIVPNHLLGRVISIAAVLAWSAIPLGTFLGGVVIEWTRNVALVYGAIGVLTFLIPFAFSFTALGRAEQYLPRQETSQEQEPDAASA